METLPTEWIDAWNAHDLDRILAHYHPDVEFTSPFVVPLMGRESGTLHGLAELRDYFTRALDAYPDLRFEPIAALTGVRSVVLHYRSVRNLLAAEVMEVDEHGKVVRVRAHYSEACRSSAEPQRTDSRKIV